MLDIDICYDVEKIEEYYDEDKIKEYLEYILKNEKDDFDSKTYYISFMLTTNPVIHKINKEYRNVDRPTDVISFAYNETENIGPMEVVGDIIISIDKVKEQAKEYGHSDKREFFYLLTHGMLHILGYDHIEADERKIMREKEERYLSAYEYKR
ncbi:rRNA maturation RNase YbeY [Sneathia sanguinegens]|uniref:Endoribonuclease YbeY n=1 Tax=Sneathia sanguinegens TaxID=40543 RepID=A0ABT7HKA1_9FUSO|nr:rRNA maturation RNase YbeY [Sneathia sanguinegens]MDK9580607.1 rRNA maturation RNase YbeY [Sneathia sanguinegens]MDU4652061.1 rRNA maturation RNase YbeY [Sneathia sanguinegens]